jgi:tetratricopeptide (TPR) repeat protein
MYETYYNLGIAATQAKKYEMAIDAFENGIKIKSDYDNFYYSLAVAQAEYAEDLLEEKDVEVDTDDKEALQRKIATLEIALNNALKNKD